MIQPAEYHQASLTKTVAVLPFSGKGGVEFGAELEGLLTSIDINGHPYFTVVDRVSIDKVVSELKLSQSALADSSTAVKLGQIIGAQGIYTGAVTVNNVRDNDFRTQRSECVEYQMKRDEKGNLHQGSCIRWRKYYVNCTRRQANVSVTPKLIDVATSKILYSKNISGAAESSGCEDGSPPQGKQELLDLARQTVKNVIRKDIAPYYVTTMVKLKDETDGMDLSAAKDRLRMGIRFAESRRMDVACEQWGEARQMAPESPSILYNLAICAETVADLDSALRLYQQADRLLGKPDEDITLGLARVGKALRDRQKLMEQMKDGSGGIGQRQ